MFITAEARQRKEERKEDRDYYERQRLDQERRSDVESEREFWVNVMLSCLGENGASVKHAVAQADEAMRLYKERFQ